jgi:hypothetical protein
MSSAAQQYDAAVEREFTLEASAFDPLAEKRKLRTAGIAAIEAAVASARRQRMPQGRPRPFRHCARSRRHDRKVLGLAIPGAASRCCFFCAPSPGPSRRDRHATGCARPRVHAQRLALEELGKPSSSSFWATHEKYTARAAPDTAKAVSVALRRAQQTRGPRRGLPNRVT